MNIALAILHLYPEATPMRDFEVRDDSDGKGPYIAVWNLDAPQPTEEELQAAWEAYQAEEAAKILEPTELERLQQRLDTSETELTNTQLALADTYEQLLAAQTETTNVQLALTDVYEQLIALQGGAA